MDNHFMPYKNSLAEENPAKKETFLTVLCTLAKIDKNISDEEIAFIKELAQNINVEIKPSFFTCPPQTCLQKLVSFPRHLALELLKYLLVLAYTDNEFSDAEGHFICNVADTLNIEPQKVSEISSWVIDRIIWLEQEEIIFEKAPLKKQGEEHV